MRRCTTSLPTTGITEAIAGKRSPAWFPLAGLCEPCGCWLLQFELRVDRGAVLRDHGHAIAVVRGLRRLPVVDELAARSVVTQARAARRRLLDVVQDHCARAA